MGGVPECTFTKKYCTVSIVVWTWNWSEEIDVRVKYCIFLTTYFFPPQWYKFQFMFSYSSKKEKLLEAKKDVGLETNAEEPVVL